MRHSEDVTAQNNAKFGENVFNWNFKNKILNLSTTASSFWFSVNWPSF